MKENYCYFVIGSNFRTQLTIIGIVSDIGLAPWRWQAVTWTNDDLVVWRTHGLQGLNELSYVEVKVDKSMWGLEDQEPAANWTLHGSLGFTEPHGARTHGIMAGAEYLIIQKAENKSKILGMWWREPLVDKYRCLNTPLFYAHLLALDLNGH